MNAVLRDPGTGFPVTPVRQKMLVIGGGIVGTCCALSLQRAGHAVTMVDPAEPGDSTAKWSCGQISVGEIIPLSKPAIIKAAPGWLMDQTGPLAMRVGALPGILPWFLRFASNARRQRIHEISAAMASLTRHVFVDYAPLIEAAGDSTLIGQRPILQLFESAEAIARERDYIARRRELGFDTQAVGAAEIAELEPALAGRFQHGLLLPQWRFVSDTEGFIRAMTRTFEAAGGQRVRGDVRQILEEGGRASGVRLASGETLAAAQLVLAAGAGARRFFSQLGLNVPLQGVAGYQALLPDPGVEIRHSVIYAAGGFCFTPMSRGLQIGGTIEFAGHGAEPNFKRAEIILAKAKALLPKLNTQGVEFGVGHRPLVPDTKPIIDRCRRLPNVLLAVGHGQLGLTLGATTGRLITELATQGSTTQDISAFSAYRY